MTLGVPCIISIGSNLAEEEAKQNVVTAQNFLRSKFDSIIFSSIYQTPGEGKGHGQIYSNCIARAYTSISKEDIIKSFKDLESSLGRTAETKRRGIVSMDLDLLSYGEEILKPRDFEMNYSKQGLSELN